MRVQSRKGKSNVHRTFDFGFHRSTGNCGQLADITGARKLGLRRYRYFADGVLCSIPAIAGEGLCTMTDQFSAFKNLFKGASIEKRGRAAGGQRKKRVLKKGSKDLAYLALLKRYSGEKTIAELAESAEMDEKTMRSTVSRVLGTLRDMGASDEQIEALAPKGYGEGAGRGRQAAAPVSFDDLSAMLEAPAEDFDDVLAGLGIDTESDESEESADNE